MSDPSLDLHVRAVRRFNRFYTALLGLLDRGLLQSDYSLTEVRVLYEVAHRDHPMVTDVGQELGLDPGYTSRLVSRLQRAGLVRKRRSSDDARRSLLALTARGRAVFADLDRRADEQVRGLLDGATPDERRRLTAAMREVEAVLAPRDRRPAPFVLRPPRPGDLGWVVHRHGALYAQEYGWDEQFEGLVARIVAEFAAGADPARERCWIAERGGEVAGSVFLVRASREVAKLRLLLVEPWARGSGLGGQLVDECTRFARGAGYARITLWTNSVLAAARRIYERAGYRLVHEEPHHSFGHDLVGQTWELAL